MNLSKKIFGSNVDGSVRTYLNNMQKGTFEILPGDAVSFNSGQTYLGNRTPYARMWVAVNTREVKKEIIDGKVKYKDVGDSKNTIYLVNTNEENTYDSNPNEPVGKQLKNNPYLKPASGITSINSKSEGAVGALRRTSVEFMVHNKEDFEKIFLPFFLKPGATIFVDFGWSDKGLDLYDPNDLITNKNLNMDGFYTEIFKSDGEIGEGFKTTLSGQVTKYDVNVDENGSFKCNLEFVSSNYALLDKTIDDDNNLKFMFNNAIEELIMGYYLNFSNIPAEQIDGIINFKEINKLSFEERRKLTKEFFDADTKPGNTGLINPTSKKSGVFYQNLSGGSGEEDKLDAKEALYISFGLFEDKFLNNFISFWQIKDDDGKVVERVGHHPYANTFANKNSYARYDENLYTLQSLPFQDADERVSYLYPDTWGDTYNKDKPIDWVSKNEDGKTGSQIDIEKKRIPLRDLFISVPLISEAFAKSTNVNDSLEYIFDQIKDDSGGIINVKMVPNNNAQTSIAFHDVNVSNLDEEPMLQFDLTSGNTIVLNSDLKFETPKAGLSSMIAIGNLKQPTIFGEDELDKFNLMNAIDGDDKKFKVRHLPIYGEVPARQKALSLNLSKVLASTNKVDANKNIYSTSGMTPAIQFENYIKARDTVIKTLDDPESEKAKAAAEEKNKIENDDDLPTETEDGKQIIYAKSRRDSELLTAKINNFLSSADNSISPVMPITLTLKVYGNNFLGIGDYFNVNFLPKHYEERVFFQIVGVDHNMGTSMWDTTYTTVMRLKANKTYKTFGNNPSDSVQVEVRFHPMLQKKIIEDIVDEIADGEMKNDALSLITENVKNGGTSNLTLEQDSAANRDDAAALNITYDDIPDIAISTTFFDVNPGKNPEKLKKLKEEGLNIFTDKLGYQVRQSDEITRGELAYWQSMSNLLLGPDVIDWKKADEEGNGFYFHQRKIPPFAARGDLKIKDVHPGEIYIFPRIDGGNVYNSWNNKDIQVGENYGQFILSALPSAPIRSKKAGDYKEMPVVETSLNVNLRLDKAQIAIDNIIKGVKQTLSPNIKLSGKLTKRNTKTPYFLDTIVWKIEVYGKDNLLAANNFTNLQITGHKDFNILPNILIPTKYFKMPIDKFKYLLWKKYVGLKTGFLEAFE